MALVNKNYEALNEYARFSFGKENEVPLGFEFEFDIAMLNTNLEKHGYTVADVNGWRGVRDYGHPYNSVPSKPLLPDYIWSKMPKRYKRSGDCGLEVKSYVAPLSLHKSALVRMGFFDLPHSVDPNNDAGIHVGIGCTAYTDPVKQKVFNFLNTETNHNTLMALSGRNAGSWRKWVANGRQSGSHKYNVINDCHDTRPDKKTAIMAVSQGYTLFDANGRVKKEVPTVQFERSQWWELRMFDGQPQYLLPALEFSDVLPRLAHEMDELTISAIYEYARGFPKYKELAALMAQRINHILPQIKTRSKANVKASSGTGHGGGGQDHAPQVREGRIEEDLREVVVEGHERTSAEILADAARASQGLGPLGEDYECSECGRTEYECPDCAGPI